MTPTRAIPELSGGLPLLRHLFEFRDRRIALLDRIAKESPEIVRFRIGRLPVLVISSPELVRELLVERAGDFKKSRGLSRFARPVFGDGLLTSEGAHHRRQRLLMAAAFHNVRLATYAEAMSDESAVAVERLLARDGQVVDVAPEMLRLTLRIVARTLFRHDVSQHVETIGRCIELALAAVMAETTNLVPHGWPTPGRRRFREVVRELEAIVYGVIEERRRAGGADRGDLLSTLLAARDEQGQPMTDLEIRDEVMTLLLAGHETTGAGLAWTLALLARHPEAQDRLANDAPFAAMAFKESLRLYPPAYLIGREALVDTRLGDYPVPAGQLINVNVRGLHRRPDVFEAPDEYRPERFAPEREKQLPKGAFLPFGDGPRVCIGSHFAMTEAQIALAMLVRGLRFEPEGGLPTPEPLVTLRPRGGVMLRVTARPA